MKNKEIFIDSLNKLNISFKEDEPMKNHTTFKIGGNTPIFITPSTINEIESIINLANRYEIPLFFLGRGSNLLVNDDGIDMAVISFSESFKSISHSKNELTVQSGASLISVCNYAKEHSLSGLEFAYGIPGSIGGAVFMNAGAYGGEMKNVIKSVTYLDEKGNIHTKNTDELEFSYRHSYFKEHRCAIISATIELTPDIKADITARMNDYMNRRKEKQPINYPSAGSTFKRPKGAFAGALIEQCGLKGYTVGGAQISKLHAGFVINVNNATARDVNTLMTDVKNIVFEKTGYTLEPEIILL